MNERDTNSSQNSRIRWNVQKVQGEKPPKKARFPVYLHFITERMRYFAYLRWIHARTHARMCTDERITHAPPLGPSWRTILVATSLQRRLFRRKVPNGDTGLEKKRSQGVQIRGRRDEWRNKPLRGNYIL